MQRPWSWLPGTRLSNCLTERKMSYIDDALKKAQRERDGGRYGRFGGIIASGAERPGQPRKRTLAVGVAVMLLVLVPVGLILFVYVTLQPSPSEKSSPQPVVAGNAEAFRPSTPQAAGGRLRKRYRRARRREGLRLKRRQSRGKGRRRRFLKTKSRP